jgi:hypothetical protein
MGRSNGTPGHADAIARLSPVATFVIMPIADHLGIIGM